MITFNKIQIKEWRQYNNIEIDFHKRLTILTGANGAGKTTLLNILNRHYGWNIQFIATPEKDKEQGGLRFLSGIWNQLFGKANEQQASTFGKITYSDGAVANLQVPPNLRASQYQLSISGLKALNGLHIPSHRPVFCYQPVGNIPTLPPKRQNIIQTHKQVIMQPFHGGNSTPVTSHIKQTLIALAVFGEGNKYVTKDFESLRLFEGFQSILKRMLPPELGFEKLQIENPEIILQTKSGNFTLDAVSGGIASIIDLSWQIFMSIEEGKSSVVTIDEPENHLHPKLQRVLLPNLLEAFPNTQFIVVTHNPVIVTSVPESNVYALDFGENHKVETRRLDFVNKAADANETLRDVLGLSSASPIWVEEKINQIVNKYTKGNISAEQINNMRDEFKSLGLEKTFPSELAKIWK